MLVGCVALFGADPSGKWSVTAVTDSGREYKLAFTLQNDAGKWTGTMESAGGSIPVSALRVSDQEVSCKVSTADADYDIKLALAGDALKGTFTGTNGATGKMTGNRAAAVTTGFAGNWKGSATSSTGKTHDVQLILRDDQGNWTGSIVSDRGEAGLANIKADGSQLSFEISVDEGTYRVQLTLADAAAKGTYTGPNNESGSVSLGR